MYLKMSKTRDTKLPTRANSGADAGIDFYVPNDWNGGSEWILQPGQSVKIPAGIKVEVPAGYALIFFNKSGVAAKKSLIVGACVIDHGYAGEVHINMINVGQENQLITAGDKIVQGILVPVITFETLEVPEDELYRDIHVAGNRGAGGFGSTGEKAK
jgi:dUTP pyrophosphatase